MPVAGEEEDAVKLEIGAGTDRVLVEIKATTGDVVRMSTRQVDEAVDHPDRYFLCAISVPADVDIDVDFFQGNAKFVADIGHRLERLWSEYTSIRDTIGDAETDDEGVELEMSGQQVRFSVRREVWGASAGFATTLKLLQDRMIKE